MAIALRWAWTRVTGMAELFGKATGCSKGKGGSMHFFDAEAGNMGGHGIVGGHIPLGLGLAFAQSYKKTGGVTFCLLRRRCDQPGHAQRSIEHGQPLQVPAIFIVENNGVAMGTQVERASAERTWPMRACGYRMPHYHIDGNDVDTVIAEFGKAVERARSGGGPELHRRRHLPLPRALDVGCDEVPHQGRAGRRPRQRDPIVLYEVRLRERA